MSFSPTDRPTAAGVVEVTMPQMGVSVAEGTVVLWRKQVGDRVEADETICEITTDKIDSEVPAPASGRVVELLVEVEETVAVGTPLARIATAAEKEGPAAGEPGGAEGSAGLGVVEQAPTNGNGNGNGNSGSRHHYSPVVQRIASREGIDLELVHGTGRGGRVSKQDVLAFLHDRTGGPGEARRQQEPPMHIESPYREEQAAEAPNGRREPAVRPGPAAASGAQHGGGTGAGAAGAGTAPGGERLSRMRRSIAAHMVESLRTAAHCTSITEADMSRIETARAELGLSYLPFVARCVIDALRAYPELNATLEDETLTLHHSVHLGIAVSLDREGLIVPVVHDAHELSHEGLARRIRELAQRARAGELTADEVRGGTFTITNPGGYGTIASTPIINQPQVAILDLEAVVKRPVVVTDRDGRESMGIRPMTNLCLSWDHRALDGALAAQFLGCVRDHIEHWSS